MKNMKINFKGVLEKINGVAEYVLENSIDNCFGIFTYEVEIPMELINSCKKRDNK